MNGLVGVKLGVLNLVLTDVHRFWAQIYTDPYFSVIREISESLYCSQISHIRRIRVRPCAIVFRMKRISGKGFGRAFIIFAERTPVAIIL
jgi:hypothetical protein